jgi:beta-xylosidase
MNKINRSNVAEHLVDYQLGMVGKTIAEAYKNETWFTDWTMTDEQFQQLKAYAIPLIKKIFKCNKKRAESNFDWWNLQFGLRIDNSPKQQDYEEI